jgi:hypothetical protein
MQQARHDAAQRTADRPARRLPDGHQEREVGRHPAAHQPALNTARSDHQRSGCRGATSGRADPRPPCRQRTGSSLHPAGPGAGDRCLGARLTAPADQCNRPRSCLPCRDEKRVRAAYLADVAKRLRDPATISAPPVAAGTAVRRQPGCLRHQPPPVPCTSALRRPSPRARRGP